jgi:DNA-binding MarR family transcriptional regulator
MTSRLSDKHLAAWRLFITGNARLLDRIDRDLVSAGCIPLHWYDVLVELVEAPDNRLRLTELAQRVVLSKSGLSRLVDKLEEAGYLTREPTPDDKRGAYAVLTETGRAALRQAWSVYARSIQTYFAQYLDEADTQLMTKLLERLIAGLDSDPT